MDLHRPESVDEHRTGCPGQALARLQAMAQCDDLAAFCEPRGIRLLVVHGSAVRPDWPAAPHDIDLAVLADDQDPPWGFAGLVGDLIELLRTDAVDLMDLSRAGPLARAEALTHCQPLYEDRSGRFAEQQMSAITERMETRHLRSLDLDLLAR